MQLSQRDEFAVRYTAFEKAFIQREFSAVIRSVCSTEEMYVFVTFYVVRVVESYPNQREACAWVVPRLIGLAEFMFAYYNKRVSLEVLLWTVQFCRQYQDSDRSWAIGVLNVELADMILSTHNVVAFRTLFQQPEVVFGLPEAIMRRAETPSAGAHTCNALATALFSDTESYALGRGHIQLVSNLYIRLLCEPCADKDRIQKNLDITLFYLDIWDKEQAGRPGLYTKQREQQAVYLRRMLSAI